MEQFGTMLYAIWHWFDANPSFRLLAILMTCDVITGILQAARQRAISSEISSAGMIKKVGMIVLVLVAKALESQVNSPVAAMVAIFFSMSEGISIIENAGQLGVPIPPVMTRLFAQLGEQNQAAQESSVYSTTTAPTVEQATQMQAALDELARRGH